MGLIWTDILIIGAIHLEKGVEENATVKFYLQRKSVNHSIQ